MDSETKKFLQNIRDLNDELARLGVTKKPKPYDILKAQFEEAMAFIGFLAIHEVDKNNVREMAIQELAKKELQKIRELGNE